MSERQCEREREREGRQRNRPETTSQGTQVLFGGCGLPHDEMGGPVVQRWIREVLYIGKGLQLCAPVLGGEEQGLRKKLGEGEGGGNKQERRNSFIVEHLPLVCSR